MKYERQLLKVLSEASEKGISVRSIVKHVYNQNCTLFVQPDLQEIHNCVQRYLLKKSKGERSLIERTNRRGYYRLNTLNNADARQLMLEFREQTLDKEEKEEKPQVDFSLSLFD